MGSPVGAPNPPGGGLHAVAALAEGRVGGQKEKRIRSKLRIHLFLCDERGISDPHQVGDARSHQPGDQRSTTSGGSAIHAKMWELVGDQRSTPTSPTYPRLCYPLSQLFGYEKLEPEWLRIHIYIYIVSTNISITYIYMASDTNIYEYGYSNQYQYQCLSKDISINIYVSNSKHI